MQYSAEAQFAKSQCLKDTRQRQQYQHGLSMVHKHTDENTQKQIDKNVTQEHLDKNALTLTHS